MFHLCHYFGRYQGSRVSTKAVPSTKAGNQRNYMKKAQKCLEKLNTHKKVISVICQVVVHFLSLIQEVATHGHAVEERMFSMRKSGNKNLRNYT